MPALDRLNGEWAHLHRPDYQGFAMDVILAGLQAMLEAAVKGSTGGSRAAQPR